MVKRVDSSAQGEYKLYTGRTVALVAVCAALFCLLVEGLLGQADHDYLDARIREMGWILYLHYAICVGLLAWSMIHLLVGAPFWRAKPANVAAGILLVWGGISGSLTPASEPVIISAGIVTLALHFRPRWFVFDSLPSDETKGDGVRQEAAEDE